MGGTHTFMPTIRNVMVLVALHSKAQEKRSEKLKVFNLSIHSFCHSPSICLYQVGELKVVVLPLII